MSEQATLYRIEMTSTHFFKIYRGDKKNIVHVDKMFFGQCVSHQIVL